MRGVLFSALVLLLGGHAVSLAQSAKLSVQVSPAAAGVRVEIEGTGQQATTGASGRVSFIVPPYFAVVRGTSPAGEVVRRSLNVGMYGSSVTLPFVEAAPQESRAESGLRIETVAGARVRLSGGRQATADENGVARFSGLTPGSYSVAVTRAGYTPARTRRVILRSAEVRELAIALTRAPAPETPPPPPAAAAAPRSAAPEQAAPVGAAAGAGTTVGKEGVVAILSDEPAQVELRGALRGWTGPGSPLALSLPPGEDMLVVRAAERVPDTIIVRVTPGGATRVRARLRPRAAGRPAASGGWARRLARTSAAEQAAGLLSVLLLGAAALLARSALRQPTLPSFGGEIVTGRFDRYWIVDLLGRGGMATIYRARTDEGGAAALKLMNPDLLLDGDLLVKFLREGRILQTMNTRFPEAPIVRVLRYGREHDLPDGRPFIAMEYLQGGNLLEYLRSRGGVLAVEEAVQIVREIARGLAAAHQCGVFHRDLTPDNVMMLRGWPEIELRLIDFGVARHEFTSVHTLDGSIFGKPAYMAPEQCRGGSVDERTDLYALGVILYLLLTGRTPFSDANPLAVMRMHESAVVPPLPATVPAAVGEVVSRLLHKDPAGRFRNATALLEQLALPTVHT